MGVKQIAKQPNSLNKKTARERVSIAKKETMIMRNFTAICVLVVLACVPTLKSTICAAEQAQGETGSIQGTISVSGVRSPENVLVYLEEVPGDWPVSENARVDQVKLVFIPHVLPIVKGSTVHFLNNDPILHNIFWPKSKNNAYPTRNLGTWGKGGEKSFKFDKLGDVVLLCNVHPEMEGHVVVLQNPFFVVVEKNGAYEIENVPPGTYTVKTWYPQSKRLRAKSASVTVESGQTAELDFSLSRR